MIIYQVTGHSVFDVYFYTFCVWKNREVRYFNGANSREITHHLTNFKLELKK